MRVVIDIEANGLTPDKVWVIVCKDIDTGVFHVFRQPTEDPEELTRFLTFARGVKLWIGHNIIGYDLPVLMGLCFLPGIRPTSDNVIDTLVVSRLLDYSIDGGHSIEAWGDRFECPKIEFNDWTKYSLEMEQYCVRDVEISHRIFNSFTVGRIDRVGNILSPTWKRSIDCEQRFETITADMHHNGFGFDIRKCNNLLAKITDQLSKVDEEFHSVFPLQVIQGKEIVPRRTKHGTLNRSDFRFIRDGDLSDYNGGAFCRVSYEPFNPDSHKQVVDLLTKAGWSPIDKTKTHLDLERAAKRRDRDQNIDYTAKLASLSVYGWKINETNLSTLPSSSPKPARAIAKRIVLESRRRTLTEWSDLCDVANGRIHGKFYGIGSWTHRMAHQQPNTANIPNEHDTQGNVKLYGGEMRSLWCAPANRLLVGVDAEGIQLRIFAHYIDDPEFTHEVSSGDPHSLNQRVLGDVCKARASAKRFIYALLLGAGLSKLSAILEASEQDTKEALDRLLERYQGYAWLKSTQIPRDAKRGFFYGLDGRAVKILGDTESQRRHLAMSGFLQNGEVVIMKHATILWGERLSDAGYWEANFKEYEPGKDYHKDWKLVDMVHDEWQTECMGILDAALFIAQTQADAIRETGEMLGVKCPLAGSYTNKDLLKKGHPFPYTIDTNWRKTH